MTIFYKMKKKSFLTIAISPFTFLPKITKSSFKLLLLQSMKEHSFGYKGFIAKGGRRLVSLGVTRGRLMPNKPHDVKVFRFNVFSKSNHHIDQILELSWIFGLENRLSG